MKKKKILYVEGNIDGTIGGSYFSLLFLVEGLNKSKYSPIVVFYRDNSLIPRFRKAGCKVIIRKKTKALNIVKALPFGNKCDDSKLIKIVLIPPILIFQKIINYFVTFVFPSFKCWVVLVREGVDLIHLNNTLLRPQEWILASLFYKTKVIAHERGINKSFHFQSRFWSRFLGAIVCISNAVKKNLLNHGFPEDQLIMIYNGLNPDTFNITKTKTEVLNEFDIHHSSPVVGIVGSVKVWKGQEVVIRSLKHVKKHHLNITCLIIGGLPDVGSDYLKYLRNLTKAEGVDENVIFTGYRNDIPSLINALDILIHASTEPEPFGRVLLEGMALAKPIITTNIGAGPEIVEDGKTGLIVPPNDEESLASAIVSLLKEKQIKSEMGRAGRIRIENNFHLSKNISKTEELYTKLIPA